MIGDATARQVMDEIRLRRVDKVKVKGRSQAVETFTPCADNETIRLNDEAIRLFRAQSWDESERLWRELLVHQPNDRIAEYYLERIAAHRASPPQSDWDGAVALDKL
jgi:adenylate cyclase